MRPPARILILEDEQVLAKNLHDFLSRRSYDVRIAPDAASAMEMLESYAPNLVILDYGLPGIDGLRAYADIVRASPQQPRCVLITGYLTRQMARQAHQQGIRHLLCKPFRLADLLHLIGLSGDETPSELAGVAFPAPLACD